MLASWDQGVMSVVWWFRAQFLQVFQAGNPLGDLMGDVSSTKQWWRCKPWLTYPLASRMIPFCTGPPCQPSSRLSGENHGSFNVLGLVENRLPLNHLANHHFPKAAIACYSTCSDPFLAAHFQTTCPRIHAGFEASICKVLHGRDIITARPPQDTQKTQSWDHCCKNKPWK